MKGVGITSNWDLEGALIPEKNGEEADNGDDYLEYH